MSEERKERCGTCRFYCRDSEEILPEEGECRRNAPRPAPRKSLLDSEMRTDPCHVWPLVDKDDWCGEWQAKEIAKPSSVVNGPDELWRKTDLPVRVINALELAGIMTVSDLAKKTRQELMDLRGIGSTSLRLIQHALGSS